MEERVESYILVKGMKESYSELLDIKLVSLSTLRITHLEQVVLVFESLVGDKG
jgi:hypothetical protein